MRPRSLFFSALLFVPACSSSAGSGDTPVLDAGRDAANLDAGSEAANDAASDAQPVCNTLANTASSITVQQVASDPPALAGGTLVDGTYTLTAAIIYTGPSGPAGPSGSAQTTLQVTGNTIEVASTGEPATRTVTFSTSGTSIDSVDTCPDTDARPGSYTATATTFIVALDGGTDDAGARTLVETFTKQ